VLENIESGRKADLSISQLLNVARALRVPPAYLLANVTTPASSLDLPNLSDDFAEMTAGDLEAWFTGTLGGNYRSSDPDERLDLQQLDAYRTLTRLQRELTRQHAINSALDGDPESPRTAQLQAEITELEDYLRQSGWTLRARG
jgi:transcriptional regulator with XRE-family HTH domain